MNGAFLNIKHISSNLQYWAQRSALTHCTNVKIFLPDSVLMISPSKNNGLTSPNLTDLLLGLRYILHEQSGSKRIAAFLNSSMAFIYCHSFCPTLSTQVYLLYIRRVKSFEWFLSLESSKSKSIFLKSSF